MVVQIAILSVLFEWIRLFMHLHPGLYIVFLFEDFYDEMWT